MSEFKRQLRTPLIKPRKQGGTFYTFGSALEDIGLNINELNNKVVLSHYVLLNIPEFDASTYQKSNVDYTNTSVYSDQAGDYIFAEGFQNYVLNMETTVRNDSKYDFSNSGTISERIFWKWLKSQMNLDEVSGEDSAKRYIDKNHIAKCFGYINSGAQRSDDYSMYNETFVQIPSSYGQMNILYKVTDDDNYYAVNKYYATAETQEDASAKIENINESEYSGDIINKTSISWKGIFDGWDIIEQKNYYEVSEDTDMLNVDFNLDSLRSFYGNELLTYDDLAMNDDYILAESFDFNAALIYYSIYDSTGKNILATNAYGLLVFDKAVEDAGSNGHYIFVPMNKRKATATKSGTSFSFRVNIKASSVYNGDTAVTDNSTPAYSMSTDFNDTVKNLNTIMNIMKSNANLTASINSDYQTLKSLTVQAIEKAEQAEKDVMDLRNGMFYSLNSSTFHADTVYVNNGIKFSEGYNRGITYNSGIEISTDIIDASNGNISNINTDNIIANNISIPDYGTIFTNSRNYEELARIDSNGLSTKNISIKQDNTVSGNIIDNAVLNDVFDNIEALYDNETGTFSIKILNEEEGVAGNILNSLYDPITNKVDVKGLLTLLIAKIKSN